MGCFIFILFVYLHLFTLREAKKKGILKKNQKTGDRYTHGRAENPPVHEKPWRPRTLFIYVGERTIFTIHCAELQRRRRRRRRRRNNNDNTCISCVQLSVAHGDDSGTAAVFPIVCTQYYTLRLRELKNRCWCTRT
jgi:hypothetical protein